MGSSQRLREEKPWCAAPALEGGGCLAQLAVQWVAGGGRAAGGGFDPPAPKAPPPPPPAPHAALTQLRGVGGGHMERVCLEHREPSFSKFKAQKCKPPLQRLS